MGPDARVVSWIRAAARVDAEALSGAPGGRGAAVSREEPGLVRLIRAGDADGVAAALDAGADPRVVSDDGMSALVEAILAGSLGMVSALLAHGAEPDDSGAATWTPLLIAVCVGDPRVIDLLVERGAQAGLWDSQEGRAERLGTAYGADGAIAALNPVSAHRYCSANRNDLAVSEQAGCFHCLSVFSPAEIVAWVEHAGGADAECPRCGVDSVLPSSRVALSRALLQDMRDVWF